MTLPLAALQLLTLIGRTTSQLCRLAARSELANGKYGS